MCAFIALTYILATSETNLSEYDEYDAVRYLTSISLKGKLRVMTHW